MFLTIKHIMYKCIGGIHKILKSEDVDVEFDRADDLKCYLRPIINKETV